MIPGRKQGRWTDEEKEAIIREYLNTPITKTAIQEKYELGHCTLERWLAKAGIPEKESNHHNTQHMKAERNRRIVNHASRLEHRLMETEYALKEAQARIQELERQLAAKS